MTAKLEVKRLQKTFYVNSKDTLCSYSPLDKKDFKSKSTSRARGQAELRGRLIIPSPYQSQKTGSGQIKWNPVELQGKTDKYGFMVGYSINVS